MSDHWYETFFQGIAVDCWTRAMTPEITSAEVDYLEKTLTSQPNSRLLDVPCGNGRHAIEFARRGHHVTGVDLSAEFLAQARAGADRFPIDFCHSDMRNLPWTCEFDGAFCFGNSFGYLDAPEAEKFLRAVANALKPGGRIAIDTGMAAESILASFPSRRWYRVGDLLMLSEARYHALDGRMDIDYTFIRRGEIETRPTSSYVLTASEIRRMLERAGFSEIVASAGINGEPYQFGSSRLIISAMKKE